MYVDLKPEIKEALRSNAALISLLGHDKYGNVKVYPEVSPDIEPPYVTFFEIVNEDKKHADDTAYNSEIHFHVDVWVKGNTSPIVQTVNEAMEQLGFIRKNSIDQFERDTQTNHKILRYKKIQYRG